MLVVLYQNKQSLTDTFCGFLCLASGIAVLRYGREQGVRHPRQLCYPQVPGPVLRRRFLDRYFMALGQGGGHLHV